MKDVIQLVSVPQPRVMNQIPFPSTLIEADLVINGLGLGTHGTLG
jgi:hypothetical protein